MTELVVYPGIEALVVAYLSRQLTARADKAIVATRIPNPRPDRLVRVTAAGGGDDRLVLSSRLVITECWDTSEPAAADLAELCHALLLAARRDPAEPQIRHAVTVGAPVNHPDPDTRHPRYQFTISLDLRGHLA
ncbi:hypothetical protein [Nocardia altamirensis]|uniref:hypothetical protein n=1 Tax=Nocardia altamirensis TaxID=472158 RepID=UPI0008401741|nr:hypothetical protein [Nocardia altamirensis]